MQTSLYCFGNGLVWNSPAPGLLFNTRVIDASVRFILYEIFSHVLRGQERDTYPELNQTQRATLVSSWILPSAHVCMGVHALHLRCGVQCGCDLAGDELDWHCEDRLWGSWRQADLGRLRSLVPVPEPGEKHRRTLRGPQDDRRTQIQRDGLERLDHMSRQTTLSFTATTSITASNKLYVPSDELTASEFRRSVSISESALIHGESFPTIRVFQSRQSTRDS